MYAPPGSLQESYKNSKGYREALSAATPSRIPRATPRPQDPRLRNPHQGLPRLGLATLPRRPLRARRLPIRLFLPHPHHQRQRLRGQTHQPPPWSVVEKGWTGPQFSLPSREHPAPRKDAAGCLSEDAATRLYASAGPRGADAPPPPFPGGGVHTERRRLVKGPGRSETNNRQAPLLYLQFPCRVIAPDRSGFA